MESLPWDWLMVLGRKEPGRLRPRTPDLYYRDETYGGGDPFGCYWIYWSFKNPVALELMRSANFPASLSLYGMCGVLWLYRGSLRGFVADLRTTIAALATPRR